MDRLGLEFICTLGLPPVEHIELVAALGVGLTGLAPAPITANPHGFAPWNLLKDKPLVQATKAALHNTGVRLALGEGFLIMPGLDVADSEPLVDLMADLGAPLINCVSIEADRPRAIDQFARLAELAAARGLVLSLEFMPLGWPGTIDEAQEMILASGAANGRLLLDAMHVYRSGATTADLARLDPALIAYVQICDVPMPAESTNYGEEARDERRLPGDGDLPLAEFLKALPTGIPVGLEAPMVSKALAGIPLREALAPGVTAARALLAGVPA